MSEFDRPGSINREEYIAGLKAELDFPQADRAAVKAELDRLLKPAKETATTVKTAETA